MNQVKIRGMNGSPDALGITPDVASWQAEREAAKELESYNTNNFLVPRAKCTLFKLVTTTDSTHSPISTPGPFLLSLLKLDTTPFRFFC